MKKAHATIIILKRAGETGETKEKLFLQKSISRKKKKKLRCMIKSENHCFASFHVKIQAKIIDGY